VERDDSISLHPFLQTSGAIGNDVFDTRQWHDFIVVADCRPHSRTPEVLEADSNNHLTFVEEEPGVEFSTWERGDSSVIVVDT
jgi:hypothetical protein